MDSIDAKQYHTLMWFHLCYECVKIEAWYNDSKATIPTNIPKFQQWLNLWANKLI
jgi:hypothetical protein